VIKNNGWRKIKYAIVEEIEYNENMSDNDINEAIERMADGKECIWCDADEEIFS